MARKDNSDDHQTTKIVGGGPKKVLYTLRTVKRIGLRQSAKALKSHNACKACGLGMGGQLGGMTNELGEFPSVCNKSIQAQSTDIQPGIPEEIFEHPLTDFEQLSDHELEHLGRLNFPIFKPRHANHYRRIDWDTALNLAANRFRESEPERTFFYASGRSSNEAGFLLQLLARLFGSNNITNCSYYCHQATGVGMQNTLGINTASVQLADLKHSDLIFIIGANPASNHPRMMHQLKNCRDRGGEVVIINPALEPGLVRFAVPKSMGSMIHGGTWIASEYLQPKINGDLALLTGLAKALVEKRLVDDSFIHSSTEGFDGYRAALAQHSWSELESASGISREQIESLADRYARSERTVFAWGMGVTHHLNGVETVEAIVNLALLRGQVGHDGAGLLPLRGHSNVQGIGTVGVKPVLPEDVLTHLEHNLNVTLPRKKGLDTLACLQAAYDGNMDAALMMGGNLYAATPDSLWASQALDAVGFRLYLTTTLNRGHICGNAQGESLVLPVTARDEEWQATTQESMFNYVRLSDGGIHRLDGVKPESHILCELGKRLLPESPVDFDAFKTHNTIREAIAAAVPGMEKLARIGQTGKEFTIPGRCLHRHEFPTPSGRARFCIAPIQSARTCPSFPWLLASIRSEGQFNSIVYEESDTYRGTNSRWVALMNPEDISEKGLNAGEPVDIISAQGTMEAVTLVAFEVSRGSILAYYPEANVLTSTATDPRSHTPAFKSVPVNIRPSARS